MAVSHISQKSGVLNPLTNDYLVLERNNTLTGILYHHFVSGLATSDNLTQTGITLIGLINAASAGVSSINSQSGVLNLNGANNISVLTSGQTITVSGSGIYLESNEQRIRTIVPTGSGNLFIQFPINFISTPIIFNNIETSGTVGYYTNVSDLTTSGYMALFSDVIRESGVILYTLAKKI